MVKVAGSACAPVSLLDGQGMVVPRNHHRLAQEEGYEIEDAPDQSASGEGVLQSRKRQAEMLKNLAGPG